MTSAVAIDFGTTRTKLAYRPESGRPELMRFEDDRPYVPSLFYLARDAETILWGGAAEEMLTDDPAGVVEVLKRKLREPQVRANRRREAPQRLLAHMLADLRRQAGERVAVLEGRAPVRATLTLPALYGPVEEKILREAASRRRHLGLGISAARRRGFLHRAGVPARGRPACGRARCGSGAAESGARRSRR
jgi:molecular chaperone DnaK (HSP70)